MIPKDKDISRPEDYEFPYCYNNPCRGLLTRRNVNTKTVTIVYREANSESKRGERKNRVHFTATKDNEAHKGTLREISRVVSSTHSSLNKRLIDKDEVMKNGWTIKRERGAEVFKIIWDGKNIYRNKLIETFDKTAKFKSLSYKKRELAYDGGIVLMDNLILSKDRDVNKNNISKFVQHYASDKDRLYFGSLKDLLYIANKGDEYQKYYLALRKRKSIVIGDITIHKGDKK